MGRRLRVEADGGSRGNPGPAGYGALVRDADTGELLAEVAAGIGVATNNVAEYSGLIAGLTAAADLDPESVEVRMDSLLVVQQMAGRWKVKHPAMAALKAEADLVVRRLPRVRFTHIARELNGHADRLANEAMDAAGRGEVWARGAAGASVNAPVLVASRRVPAPNRLSGWMASAAPPCTTLLLRHGQTAYSAEKRFSGSGADPELTAYGVEQAAAAARRVSAEAEADPIAAIWTSPSRRAAATAQHAAKALKIPVRVDDRLQETDFGEWDGYTFAEIQAEWPSDLQAWLDDPSMPPPGGESFVATMARLGEVRAEITEAHPGERVLVVSHVTPIKSLLREALEAPPGILYRLHLDLACLTEIDWYADGPAVVRRLNDTCHLRGLDPASTLF